MLRQYAAAVADRRAALSRVATGAQGEVLLLDDFASELVGQAAVFVENGTVEVESIQAIGTVQ